MKTDQIQMHEHNEMYTLCKTKVESVTPRLRSKIATAPGVLLFSVSHLSEETPSFFNPTTHIISGYNGTQNYILSFRELFTSPLSFVPPVGLCSLSTLCQRKHLSIWTSKLFAKHLAKPILDDAPCTCACIHTFIPCRCDLGRLVDNWIII